MKKFIYLAAGVVLLAALFFIAVPANAAFTFDAPAETLWVATAGTSGAAGTEADPLDTIGNAAAIMSAGTMIMVKAGNYAGENHADRLFRGTQTDWIHIQGDPAGARPVFTGQSDFIASAFLRFKDVEFNANGNAHVGLDISDDKGATDAADTTASHWILFDNVRWQWGSSATGATKMLYAEGANHVRFINGCEFDGQGDPDPNGGAFGVQGLGVSWWEFYGTLFTAIEGNSYQCGATAFGKRSGYFGPILFHGCTFSDIGHPDVNNGDRTWAIGAGARIGMPATVGDCSQCRPLATVDTANTWSVQDLIVVASVFDSVEVIFAINSAESLQVWNNTFVKTREFFFTWADDPDNANANDTANLIVKNNIFLTPRIDANVTANMDNTAGADMVVMETGQASSTIDNNIWWSPYGSKDGGGHEPATNIANVSWAADLTEADPLVVAYESQDYSLDASSSADAISGGTELLATYGVLDFDGNTFTTGNVGAFFQAQPANLPPVAVADNPGAVYTLDQSGTLTIADGATDVLTNDTDPEDDAITAVISITTAHGQLVLNADGSFTYIHDGSIASTDFFTYFANDGTQNSATTATVIINITVAVGEYDDFTYALPTNTIHVATNGTNGGPGTVASPYDDISSARAHTGFGPGYEIIVHEGTYGGDFWGTEVLEGNSTDWVHIVGAAGEAMPQMNGQQQVVDPKYLRISGIGFRLGGGGNGLNIGGPSVDGWTTLGAAFIIIENCRFWYDGTSGNSDIMKAPGLNFVLLRNNEFDGGYESGLGNGSGVDFTGGHNLIIEDNIFHSFRGSSNSNAIGMKGRTGHLGPVYVRRNLFYNIGHPTRTSAGGSPTAIGIGCGGMNVEPTPNATGGAHGCGSCRPGTDTDFGDSWGTQNVHILSNLFVDCSQTICWTSSENTVIKNNTFVNTYLNNFQFPYIGDGRGDYEAAGFNTNVVSGIIENNIWIFNRQDFLQSNKDMHDSSGRPTNTTVVNNNVWHNVGTGSDLPISSVPNISWSNSNTDNPEIASYTALHNVVTNNGDPFTDEGGNYSLDAGSSAFVRAGGTTIDAEGTLDKDGVTFIAGNVGAYAFDSGGNVPPVAVDDGPSATYTVNEGATLTITEGVDDVLANDTDPDGDALTAIKFIDVLYDATGVALASDGSFVYVHDGSETVADFFTYHANDGTVNSPATATVFITITPVNDGLATAVHDDPGALYTLSQAATLSIADPADGVLANDTDPDGDPLTAVLSGNVSNGTLQLNSNGTFVYTHDGTENFTDSFTYYAHDGTGNSAATATATININSDTCSAAR